MAALDACAGAHCTPMPIAAANRAVAALDPCAGAYCAPMPPARRFAGLGELCRQTGTLLIVDTVCSLGGVPLFADAWGVDCIYSGSQKVLSGPPGAAPFFMSERAMEKLQGRKTKVRRPLCTS